LVLAALAGGCLHNEQVANSDDNPLDPASWYSVPDVCGSCIAWRPTDPDHEAHVASGVCKLRPELNTVPATMVKCTIYKPRGQFRYSAEQVSSPKRRRNKVLKVVRMNEAGEMVSGSMPRAAPSRTSRLEAAPRSRVPREIDLGESTSEIFIRQALRELIRDELGLDAPSMHPKFSGGRVEIQDSQGQGQSFPAELLFAHLVRLQDTLTQLQSQLDRHTSKLGASTAADLSNYLKRARGTMTTFNVMFQNKTDFFSSK
jgi:hypothetical protein